MRALLLAVSLVATTPLLHGCGSMETALAGWDIWRADRNQEAGKYRTSDEYHRRARVRRAEAARYWF